MEDVSSIVVKQREFFNTKVTFDLNYRLKALKTLKRMLIDNESKIEEALVKDLNKAPFEGYLTDIGPCIVEINETIKGLKKWAKPETHYSGLMCFPSVRTKVYKIPYGVTLIISPFNFPILLSIGVLCASISAGNTAIIKTSSKSKNSSEVLKELISAYFAEEYICVINGGHDVADELLSLKFDKIFYTGSPNVGKHVLEMASHNLTQVALELGGEQGNFAIIRKDADIVDAANKIAFIKILNAGQICININQVAVAKEISESFINELKKAINKQIGNALNNDEYPKLINEHAFIKCKEEANKHKDRIIYGGKGDEQTLKFEPTIIYPCTLNDDITNHELFNPLLPIIEFEDDKINELIKEIENREHPLALYLFTKDYKWAKKVMSTSQYGSGCINETCIQLMVKGVPFNGVGHSGMGAYHGEWGFKEFSHPSTVLIGHNKFNLSLRTHPYSEKKKKIIKIFEK